MGKHPIRGLISFGLDDHVVIDKSGQMIIKSSETEKKIQVLGEDVKCLRANRNMEGQVAIGSKDTLVQVWDINH